MLLTIQILAIAVAAFALDCPPKDKIYPCSCNVDDDGLTAIECEGLNSLSELEPVVKNTLGYNVSFGVFRSNLGDIPSDFFIGHTSSRLRFEQCTVKSFGDTPFHGLERTLNSLYIYSSVDKSLTNMDKFRLAHLHKLEYFSFVYNDIDEMENHWFESGPASLLQLDLDGNEIERFGERALASLVNLQQLYVAENRIKGVVRSMLPNPSKDLWLIEANSNEIEELPSDAFEGYPSLKIINLSQNKLKSIPEDVWGKVWNQLESVYLEGNNIVCDGNLKWIYARKLPTHFDGKCGPGSDLQSRELKSLKLEDFQ